MGFINCSQYTFRTSFQKVLFLHLKKITLNGSFGTVVVYHTNASEVTFGNMDY